MAQTSDSNRAGLPTAGRSKRPLLPLAALETILAQPAQRVGILDSSPKVESATGAGRRDREEGPPPWTRRCGPKFQPQPKQAVQHSETARCLGSGKNEGCDYS